MQSIQSSFYITKFWLEKIFAKRFGASLQFAMLISSVAATKN